MQENINLNDTEIRLLNYIRRKPKCTKSQLSSVLGIPWPTVSNATNKLKDNYIIRQETNETKEDASDHAKQYASPLSINPNYQFFIGISVGSSNIKIVFLDFSFCIVKQSYLSKLLGEAFLDFNSKLINELFFNINIDDEYCKWCSITPETTTEIREQIRAVTEQINMLKHKAEDKEFFNLSAICFAFPGHVDYENQRIINTANIGETGFSNCDISQIISSTTYEKLKMNNIEIFIDHNVKCCTIAEQEALYIEYGDKTVKNQVVLYLGKGIGIGMILDGRLYRGNSNMAGQFGLRKVSLSDKHIKKELEKAIREDVFDCYDTNNDFRNYSAKQLSEFISQLDNIEKKHLLVDLLEESLANVVKDLGVENIVFSGKFNQIFLNIETLMISKFEEDDIFGLTLRGSKFGEYSAAVGAAMSCFNNCYSIPFEWN